MCAVFFSLPHVNINFMMQQTKLENKNKKKDNKNVTFFIFFSIQLPLFAELHRFLIDVVEFPSGWSNGSKCYCFFNEIFTL